MNENKDFVILNISIFVVSDSRNQRSDKSGKILEENILESGHQLEEKKFVTDDKELIIKELSNSINKKEIDVVILTGGTGLTGRDSTPEAVEEVIEKKYLDLEKSLDM